MTKLMKTNQMLRVNDDVLRNLQDAGKVKKAGYAASSKAIDATNQVVARLKLGYTIARWRAETGEETAAFNRGPLVPQQVPWPPVVDWPGASNTSKEYQILDLKTGLMDLSYSSAWQLGKLLAISDGAFNSALMRFRSLVHEKASSQTLKVVNNVSTPHQVIRNFSSSVSDIRDMSHGHVGEPRRVQPLRTETHLTNLDHPLVAPKFKRNIASIVNFQGSAEKDIYNEFNLSGPNNSDWVTIFTWLSEKLFLTDIPAHFLIPDPSYLPNEAMRFFIIDDVWLDCLIDGALSVANHLDRDDDVTRLEIKQTYNVYLEKIVDGSKIKPQIPCSGFILKSQLVKVMPDLRITVNWKVEDKNRKSVCRYTKLDDTTILCLLDRMPEELDNITLSQPPHQQRFSLGNDLAPNEKKLSFQLRQLFTKTEKYLEKEWPLAQKKEDAAMEAAKGWFDWNSRCIKVNQMAKGENDSPLFFHVTTASY